MWTIFSDVLSHRELAVKNNTEVSNGVDRLHDGRAEAERNTGLLLTNGIIKQPQNITISSEFNANIFTK